jgi:hypothetical protein
LPEILARAKAELNRNPSITRYTMVGGRELRQRVEPWASFRASLQQLGQAFLTIRPEVGRFREALHRSLASMPAAPIRPSGVPVPERHLRLLSVDDSLSPAPPRHPDLDVFDQAVADYEAEQD